MPQLNYHHLRYFWAIAQEQNLTRAAKRLHVSQSALSIQLRQLEERLGHDLFDREGRRLVLTEAGRITLDHAQRIFRTGDELLGLLHSGHFAERQILRIGAVATLSRNFQQELLRPMMARPNLELVLRSGSLRELLAQLAAHTLDVVLSNLPVQRDADNAIHTHLIAQQPVSLVGKPRKGRAAKQAFVFPDDLRQLPVVVPSAGSELRAAFDLLLDQAGIRPTIMAEVDDMAMLRLFARDSDAVTLVPPVVVRDELRSGALVEYCRIPEVTENFYAITISRQFQNPLIRELLAIGKEVKAAGGRKKRAKAD
jgi:LysR family transcriptional regulator, transcriptional activator of nhaA